MPHGVFFINKASFNRSFSTSASSTSAYPYFIWSFAIKRKSFFFFYNSNSEWVLVNSPPLFLLTRFWNWIGFKRDSESESTAGSWSGFIFIFIFILHHLQPLSFNRSRKLLLSSNRSRKLGGLFTYRNSILFSFISWIYLRFVSHVEHVEPFSRLSSHVEPFSSHPEPLSWDCQPTS